MLTIEKISYINNRNMSSFSTKKKKQYIKNSSIYKYKQLEFKVWNSKYP